MDQRERYRSDLVERHLGLMSKRGRLKPAQVPEYRRELLKMLSALEAEGMGCTPSQIGEKEIEWLINTRWSGLSAKTKRWYLSILNGLLKRHRNTTISDMQLGWPRSQRVNVEWLTPEEAVILMDAAVGAANRTETMSQEFEWARSDFVCPRHLARDEIAVKSNLFMLNRLLQLQANAELRGMVL